MKLSDVRGDRVFDVIADIIVPVTEIAGDERAMRLFDPSGKPDDMTPWQFFVRRAREAIPAIMRDHRDEICQIMASINGVTVDQYVNGVPNEGYDPDDPESREYEQPPLNVLKLFKDVLDLVTDSEFVSFFS